MQSPFYRAIGDPYRGKLLEFGAHLLEVGEGFGNPAPKLADRWKFVVLLGKSDLTEKHLVTDSPSTVGQKITFVQSTTVDIPPAAEPLAPPLEAPEAPEDEKEEPKAEPEEGEEMQENSSETKMTPGVPSSSRGEKRTQPQQNVIEKQSVMKKKSEATCHTYHTF